jgi:Ca2+-binding EF-hand superfamily protein
MDLDSASLLFHLRRLGYSNEADHFRSLLSSPVPPSIPAFSFQRSDSKAHAARSLLNEVVTHRIRLFRETIIYPEDVQLLTETLTRRTRDRASIPWSSLLARLGKAKGAILFAPALLDAFAVKATDQFLCGSYLNFLNLLLDIQSGISSLVKVDPAGSDVIDVQTFERFVHIHCDLIQSLAPLAGDLAALKDFYVAVVVTRASFILCHPGSTTFSMRDLVISPPFIEFVHLDTLGSKSLFSIQSANDIYDKYVALDVDGGGLLSQQNLERLSVEDLSFHFSKAFRQRLFDSMQTFRGRLDFNLFLRLYWALKSIESISAAEFFVPLFDVDEDGRVGPSDIEFFYRSIVEATGVADPNLETYQSELADMCQCPPQGFGPQDLWESGRQLEIVRNLCDVGYFED